MPKKGYKQSAAHRAKKAKAVTGKANGRWKGGRHYSTYRRIAGAKKGDGKVVHHIDSDRSNSAKSNLRVLNDPPKKGTKKAGRRTTSVHELLTKRRKKSK